MLANNYAEQLPELLNASARLHRHLCPRQVLGVRMGLLAGEMLNLDLPQSARSKRLLTIVQTDGCMADGIAVVTNCWVGRRTLRVEDYGKVAATFVDTHTHLALRIAPHRRARELAKAYAPHVQNRWEAMLLGYQAMPWEELFSVQVVQLSTPLEQLVSRAGCKVQCEACHEEIINEREVKAGGRVLCRNCAGEGYYQVLKLMGEA